MWAERQLLEHADTDAITHTHFAQGLDVNT
ncbi:unannotated protein [freshwater metagenome]|uniref:Unannotated protein n=1 Tax=freshwater metagenome TaxID=449393 RepID=A0A6J6P249_9ZZZZ